MVRLATFNLFSFNFSHQKCGGLTDTVWGQQKSYVKGVITVPEIGQTAPESPWPSARTAASVCNHRVMWQWPFFKLIEEDELPEISSGSEWLTTLVWLSTHRKKDPHPHSPPALPPRVNGHIDLFSFLIPIYLIPIGITLLPPCSSWEGGR